MSLHPCFTTTTKITVFFLSLSLMAQAQRNVPLAYPNTIPLNSVRTWDAVVPETNSNNLLITTPVTKAKMVTQYLDGLGRPLQTVVKQGSLVTDPLNPASSASAKDVVGAVEYDALGREQFQYLPFAATLIPGASGSVSDGNFKLNPFQQQAAFSTTQYPGEQYYYGQAKFEASPLNRVIESFAAGNSWMGSAVQTNEADRKSVKTKYWINTEADAVRIWRVTNSEIIGQFSTYASTVTYSAGKLYKNVTVNENNKQVIEFNDRRKSDLKESAIDSFG